MTSITGMSGASLLAPLRGATQKAEAAPKTESMSLLETWEANRRSLKEKFLAERLDTAEKIANALTPLLAGALSLPSGTMARPMAGTLDMLSRELRDVMRDMGQELKRQEGMAADGKGPVSSGFHRLVDTGVRVLNRASSLLVVVGANDAKPPGRMSAREIAAGAAGTLLDGWDDLGKVSRSLGRLQVPRVDVTV